jgi:hypothetical protein
MDTINTSTQSGGLRIRLNVSTRVPTEGPLLFEVEVELEYDAG